MTTLASPQRFNNPIRRLSLYRPPLLSQAEAFSCYYSQYQRPVLQQPWQPSDRPSEWSFDLGQPNTPTGYQRYYTPQPFRQSFVP